MSAITIILLSLLITFVFVVAGRTSFTVVQPHEAGILIVLGNYRRKLPPGVNIVPPFISMVHHINLQAQTIPFEAKNMITKDRQKVDIDGSLLLKVNQPERAFFEVTDYKKATERLAVQTLRSVIADMDYSDIIYKNEKLGEHITTVLHEVVDEWGIDIKNFGIENVERKEYG